jgi:Domain of unknown function (DUF4190)
VPTDQPGSLMTEEAPPWTSPIENELPTYRKISNRAVFSLLSGVLAAVSFADLTFLIFAVLAVVLGILANLAIKRTPDVLTGRRLANTGIAMGVIFGLTVLTYTYVHSVILGRSAAKFGREYAEILNAKHLGAYLLYREPAEQRTKSPDEKEKEYTSTKEKDRFMMDQRLAQILKLKKLLEQGGHVEFVDIERQGIDSSHPDAVYYFASAIYEVDAATKGESAHQYALAIFKGKVKGRHFEWWVEDTRFPYVRQSYEGEVKPVDDGHGHAAGAH